MEGWISLHRKIMELPDYFSEKFTRMSAWIDLLLLANHKTGYIRKRGIKVTIERGQTAVSREKLAERWQWSPGKVTRFLNELEKDGQIIQQKSNVISCITIVNYNFYQTNDTANQPTESTANQPANSTPTDTANQTPNERQTAGRITADGRQTDANNNNNKVYKDNNENNTTHTDKNLSLNITRARKFLEWLNKTIPEIQQMKEPLTEQQALSIVSKYAGEDIQRVILAMYNKDATKNKNAYATFCSFVANDRILKERKKSTLKYYTYNEMCDLIIKNRAKSEEFEAKEIQGQTVWVRKIEELNAQQLWK